MDESANTFPMDITDSSSRPWNFRPEGYLVVILAGTEEAERAEAALVEGGFRSRYRRSSPRGGGAASSATCTTSVSSAAGASTSR